MIMHAWIAPERESFDDIVCPQALKEQLPDAISGYSVRQRSAAAQRRLFRSTCYILRESQRLKYFPDSPSPKRVSIINSDRVWRSFLHRGHGMGFACLQY